MLTNGRLTCKSTRVVLTLQLHIQDNDPIFEPHDPNEGDGRLSRLKIDFQFLAVYVLRENVMSVDDGSRGTQRKVGEMKERNGQKREHEIRLHKSIFLSVPLTSLPLTLLTKSNLKGSLVFVFVHVMFFEVMSPSSSSYQPLLHDQRH